MTAREAAWADYWRAGSAGGGCLPKAMGGPSGVAARIWTDLARSLPRGAKLLDLATGDGAVPRRMREVRRDLKLLGIDLAPSLPTVAGVDVHSGVAMERLPFGDARFGHVTSQFGYEYGDTPRIAAEAARVIGMGGGLTLMIHHAAGPIVEHNLARAAGLAWVLDESGLFTRARALASARALAALPTPSFFTSAVEDARSRFPGQSAAWELATAIARTLDLGRHAPARNTYQALDTLESRARGERARIDALRAAARDEAGVRTVAAELAAHAMAIDALSPIPISQNGRPFAWLLRAKRI